MIALIRRVLCRLGHCRQARIEPDYLEAAEESARYRAIIAEAQYRMMNDLRRRQ